MTTLLDKPMVFKDFKSAVDFAHKEYYPNMPRYMVEFYVKFGDDYPELLEKLMTGEKLNDEEQKIMDAGQIMKHNKYKDGDIIPDTMSVDYTADAPKEVIDQIFKDEVKPEDSEKVELEDVPPPINNDKIDEIMEEQDETSDLKDF